MGAVYRVLDHVTGEHRALKRLRPEAILDDVMVRAFEREYQVLASLRHPRIIRVFDYDVDERGPFYTMELIEGEDLRRVAPVPYQKACLYLRDVATSLALLHARRLLHRDVTPRNVRTTPDGHCKLLDFGALTIFGRPTAIIGTAFAMAPETLRGEALDQRADLYSLGALAYWLFTARHAYPAREMAELPGLWKRPPPAPSRVVDGLPPELDSLVLALLDPNPLARPASAAEVIARLNAIAELAAEDATESDLLAQSFLLSPRFLGRTRELEELEGQIRAAVAGRGGAACVEALPGMGRTRFLEELTVRAQLAGATVLSVDASMYGHVYGTVRALALRLLDAAPAIARKCGWRFRGALAALGPEIESRLGGEFSGPPTRVQREQPFVTAETALDGWFTEASHEKPLVIAVDNVDDADHGSLGLLAALAKVASEHPLYIAVSQRLSHAGPPSLGLQALSVHTSLCTLSGFAESETVDLVHSLFGDAPNVPRFGAWLHERTAGSPLHAIEICRQLTATQVIRYAGGVWTLPVHRPDTELPAALGDALALRIGRLSDRARALAECLSLQREQPTLELCRTLLQSEDYLGVLELLGELARNDILYAEQDGYRFSSMAIREALLGGMDDLREDQNHRRLGEAFASLAGEVDAALRLRAGFHLIKGGDEMRGAALIAEVASNAGAVRTLMANLHRVGESIEAALKVYRRQRRSVYELMPLLGALAQAGYYEQRVWGDRYGDEALHVLEDISGLRTAKFLRRYCGRLLSLIVGLLLAVVRFRLTDPRERPYSFAEVLVHLMGTVTALAGTASLSLDSERATRVADTLEPFSILSERQTAVGIYRFCRSLQEIGREHEASAYETFDLLRQRFEDPRYYTTLPADGRQLYAAGAHFARATFAVFHADGKGALESADALDATGLQLYAMIASQVRYLYWMNRGEVAKAEPHREKVELAAVQVGSVWQVETWESPALLHIYTVLEDIVSATRVAHRLESMSRTVPSLRRYWRIAKNTLLLARGEAAAYTALVAPEYEKNEPRSYIGWASEMAHLVGAYNAQGRYAEARAFSERVLAHVTDADRDYVSLFLQIDLQTAVADAGLGHTTEALARLDGLLQRFEATDHPLVHGLLHETRARIGWAAGRTDEYRSSLSAMERWFRPTQNPFLIARCEEVARLDDDTVPRGDGMATGESAEHSTLRRDRPLDGGSQSGLLTAKLTHQSVARNR